MLLIVVIHTINTCHVCYLYIHCKGFMKVRAHFSVMTLDMHFEFSKNFQSANTVKRKLKLFACYNSWLMLCPFMDRLL